MTIHVIGLQDVQDAADNENDQADGHETNIRAKMLTRLTGRGLGSVSWDFNILGKTK